MTHGGNVGTVWLGKVGRRKGKAGRNHSPLQECWPGMLRDRIEGDEAGEVDKG